jgi:hypothetical protein
MRNTFTYTTCLTFLFTLVFSCKNAPKDATQPVTIGTLTYSKTEGSGCDQPDGERTNCAKVELQWPNVEQGPDALKKSVTTWAASYLTSILATEMEGAAAANASIETSAAAFIKAQKEFAKEAPDSPMSNFTAESNWDVLLNNGQYLTLEMDGFTYMGGAHGSPTAAVATFDIPTGKQLSWADLVTDTAALKTLAEKTFRAERADLFTASDGYEPFNFDSTFPFALPQNYGLAPDGIYCHYLVYEVGPYAIGNTQFTIPFEALGALSKIQPAAAASANAEVLPEMYGRKGSRIELPTFEIEVANSPDAGQTLSKQNETIIVSAFFSGDPLNEKDRDEIGEMMVANQEIELTGDDRIARFEGITFPKRLYDKLADKDVRLLINVYSGRQSSDDNLLNCAILEAKASQVRNKRFVLGCSLIAENTQSASYPFACYALPEPGATPDKKPVLLVTCTEKGQIEWAGQPVKDYAALKAAIRPVLADLIKKGAKELPGIQTEGCMMGNSSEIGSMYEELKSELLKKK